MVNEIFQAALKRCNWSSELIPKSKGILFGEEIQSMSLESSQSSIDLSLLSLENLEVRYTSAAHSKLLQSTPRKFVRFDFANEWNNLGYGKILLDGSPWALSGAYSLKDAEVLAEVYDTHTQTKISDYILRFQQNGKDYLWFNRPAGPVDGYDWVIVENFLKTSLPQVSEIPYGFEAAATMRIDCDESIATGRPLFELYKKNKFPFSMAIKTEQSFADADIQILKDVIADGGSVVSHSHTHAPNWGGSREQAKWEVQISHEVLKSLNIPGINFDYAVSPFHQNPVESVRGLKDAGLRGFVSGIICNDPEFLMARSGQVPYVDGIISHSEQCMLHGDTIHQQNNSIDIYKQSFQIALQTETFFGFLDHPFSNYWYGWHSEEERLEYHQEFLNYLSQFKMWRASLVEALQFLEAKSNVQIKDLGNQWNIEASKDPYFKNLPSMKVQFKNQNYELRWGESVVLQK